jgi:hypothetical protein
MIGRLGPGLLATALFAAPLAAPVAAQLTDLQPGRNFVSSAEFGTWRSENIDVGDADNDGDLDVIVANGGDGGAQANRIYINLGGLQAGTQGTFADESAARFAGVPNDTSRDCEFVDIDQDGDLDVHISNRGTNVNGGEPNRFYQNLGGAQAGTAGFYTEITNTAYGALVSVPVNQQVLGGNVGPFRDFACDCDFADLDDDGDMDMFHSTYGPNLNGTWDSRVFLNDGSGVFDELWPWANPGADIKTHTLEFNLADLDGDFDIDVVMSSRDTQARIYANNLYASLGPTPFQDVTQTALVATGAGTTGSNNYASEVFDADGDGDFDIWMNNYNGNADRLLRNNGIGHGGVHFTQMNAWIVGDPVVDDQSIDFLDYDGDGDLDVKVPNFSGTNWLYQSGLAQGLMPATQGIYHRTGGGGSLAALFPELPETGNGQTSLDGDAGDLDGDGDEDFLIANDGNGQNRLFTNLLGIPDVHAPTFHAVTVQGDKPAGPDAVIHAAVRDNSSRPLIAFYDVRLVHSVGDGPPVSTPMVSQGGQQFRGTLPGGALGVIQYHVEATDLAGNTGLSAAHVFLQGGGAPWSDLGFGLAGAGGVPTLFATGSLVPGSPGTLDLTGAAPSATAFLFLSFTSTPTPFKGGTLAPVPVALTIPMVTNVTGAIPLSWASWPDGLPPGTTLYLQYAVADAGAPAGTALSNALKGVTP